MLDILLTNCESVRQALAAYQTQPERLDHLLETGDGFALLSILQSARSKRLEVCL